MLIRFIRPLMLCLLVGMCSGCGKDSAPAEIVAGKVLLNGKPFSGAAVRFYNAKVGGGVFNLNDAGEFSSPKPLPIADYVVSLDRPGPTLGETPADIEWPEDKSGEIPSKYRSGGTSGLVAKVVDGEVNLFVFQLNGEASKRKEPEGPKAFQPLPEFAG